MVVILQSQNMVESARAVARYGCYLAELTWQLRPRVIKVGTSDRNPRQQTYRICSDYR